MTYRNLLEREGLLGRGFEYGEIVQPGNRRKREPPEKLWANMIPTLRLAIDLRERMVKLGASGLVIAAAYRPEGGARRSAHKWNRALDLDLLSGDVVEKPELAGCFLRQAASLFEQHIGDSDIGVGTYGAPGRFSTRRVHIDLGHRKISTARPNTWTIHGGRYHAPAVISYLESL